MTNLSTGNPNLGHPTEGNPSHNRDTSSGTTLPPYIDSDQYSGESAAKRLKKEKVHDARNKDYDYDIHSQSRYGPWSFNSAPLQWLKSLIWPDTTPPALNVSDPGPEGGSYIPSNTNEGNNPYIEAPSADTTHLQHKPIQGGVETVEKGGDSKQVSYSDQMEGINNTQEGQHEQGPRNQQDIQEAQLWKSAEQIPGDEKESSIQGLSSEPYTTTPKSDTYTESSETPGNKSSARHKKRIEYQSPTVESCEE